MADGTIGLWTVPLAVFGGAIRVSTPFLFVSLGECITERSGRINLGLEGTLVMGAMSAYGISYLTGSPWLGVLGAGVTGALLGGLAATGQRRRGWYCTHVVRHGACLLSRQAVDRADGAAPAGDRFRLVERHPASPGGASHQCIVSDRHRVGAHSLLGVPHHALGPFDPHRP